MTTRGRIARGEHQQEFEGHVQRWAKQWEPLGGISKVKVLKWVPTGDRSEAPAASRVPHLKTVRDSSLKVVFRPKQALRPQEPPQTAQDGPRSHGVVKPEDEDPEQISVQPDRAVPMETEAAEAEAMRGQGHTPEQQSLQEQQQIPSPADTERRDYAGNEQKPADAPVPARESDRALAEQAAKATLEALNADPAVSAAHPMSTHAEHAVASTLPTELSTGEVLADQIANPAGHPTATDTTHAKASAVSESSTMPLAQVAAEDTQAAPTADLAALTTHAEDAAADSLMDEAQMPLAERAATEKAAALGPSEHLRR